MARRVIATTEVQVAADVKQAEAGLEGLTESFRQIGNIAERAAQRAEVAFFNGAKGMAQGLQNVQLETFNLLGRMGQVNDAGAEMSRTFWGVYDSIRKAANEGATLEEQAQMWLNLFRQSAGALGALENNLQDADVRAEAIADSMQEAEGAIRAAGYRAEQLERALRDVGQAIDVAMAGGLEQVEDDILDTIRRLKDMGGEFRDVGRIGEQAFNDIVVESNRADASVEDVTRAVMRLARQLEAVEAEELRRIERDAQQAAAALNQTAVAANRADRSLDGMSNVVSRARSNVSSLVGVLGAAGLGYAAFSAAKAGLDMTRQLEKSEAMFLGLTGSVEGAADMLERMVMFARETPYNLASVSEASAQLLAIGDDFGVTTANVEDYLTTFGDAITMTGGSEDQFIRIVRVLGQMSATGKVLGQDMNQLAQNLPGFAVWETLAKGANTSEAELRRLQDLGQLDNLLTGNKAVEILIEGMKGIPGAAGAMERRMNTLGGAIEKFTETAQFAMVQGLQPFSETLQELLSDPVTLNSVEDLSYAFGDLLSKALQDVRPEIDDLAASGEELLLAFEDWTPVFAQVVDALGDFINFASPFVSAIGKMTETVLGFGNGLGKLALAAGLAATSNPFGIAAGVLLGVSAATDMLGRNAEDTANMIRLLAAAQEEANASMAIGEDVVLSESQRLAVQTAEQMLDLYPDLAGAMERYGVTVRELRESTIAYATGVGQVAPEVQRLWDEALTPSDDPFKWADITQLRDQLAEYEAALAGASDSVEESVQRGESALAIAGVAEEASLEQRRAAQEAHAEAVAKYWEEYGENYAREVDYWGDLNEEQAESVADMLQEQADAYADWAADIDASTDGATVSLSGLAEETDNNVRSMIDSLNENSASVNAWKDNIALAGDAVAGKLGLTDEAAKEFLGGLGELGPESAPALQKMLDNFAAGGTELEEFYRAWEMSQAVASKSVVDGYDEISGAAPTLAQSLADGTATIDDVLATLPAAMEAAGLDMEATADLIDLSDNMGTVGDEAVTGLVNALGSATNLARVRAATKTLADAVTTGTEVPLGVSSPSRVFFEIGEFVVEGLVDGIQSMDDEAYASAVQTASMLTGGIADHFKDAEDPQEEARNFAADVAETIIEELIAEQEAVADAAEALAEAAADRLAEAWDRVKDRFLNRDIAEGIAEAQAELSEARAELAAAESLAGAGGAAALSAAEGRVAAAEAALAAAEATDVAADLLADQVLKDFQRATEDTIAALQDQQAAEVDAIQARIDAATRNLDPVARAAAEAELAAAKERHETEMTALERRRDDEEEVLRRRLDNENDIREAAVKAKEDELDAFRDALDDIVDSIQDAIADLPDLRAAIGDSERDLQEAYFDQFEKLLENASAVDRNLLASIGASAGLTSVEVTDLINAAIAAESASAGAAAANLGVGQLLDLLSTGLFQIGADGALGIAAGLNSAAYEIAYALRESVQAAIDATLASLEISSPSGVTERLIGKPMAEGIAAGLMEAEGAVSSAMTGLLDNVVGGTRIPSASQLVGSDATSAQAMGMYRGPLVTMPNAVIQDATDADLVAQRVLVALAATGVE